MVHTDHMALKQIKSATNTNRMYATARWFSYLQHFEFTINHCLGQHNKVANAVIRRNSLLTILRNSITSFDSIKMS